ncbi:uncharacterized protein IL334_003603 [Kwoniella shivajii]|uniref:Uncharacterized protein n=1 Tax=Kwoniella shivajii TaxID=564305 RepID=A0ABZ1CZ91_9TREE|nr:hypothetical protein IL334_003603 [Kwoniella shivajii]
MKFSQFFVLFFAIFFISLTLAAAIPALDIEELDDRYQQEHQLQLPPTTPTSEEETGEDMFTEMEMLDNLSNAQRMARGLPLRKPGHLFNARLGPRAPAPSGA